VAAGFSSRCNFPDGIVPVDGDDVTHHGIVIKWQSKNTDSCGNALAEGGAGRQPY